MYVSKHQAELATDLEQFGYWMCERFGVSDCGRV